MSCFSGPNIVDENLILNLDAKNVKSSKGRRSIINWDTWISGTVGNATNYVANGDGNSRLIDTNPFGQSDVVWDVSNQDATSDADGGFQTSSFPIDNTKTYRFCTWIRRKTIGNGSSYIGIYAYNSLGTNVGVYRRYNAVQDANFYFYSFSWSLNVNSWYLLVGHVHPVGSGTGAMHVDTGIYNTSGTKVTGIYDCVWHPDHQTAALRSYLYYSTDTSTNQQWYQPRVDLCDGTEPTIQDLINNIGNKWNDIQTSKSGLITANIILDKTTNSFYFDGAGETISVPSTSGLGGNTTWEVLAKRTVSNNSYNMLMGHASLPYFAHRSDNKLFFSNAVGSQQSLSGVTSVSDNQWYHATFTSSYNGTSTEMKIYLNGKLDSSVSYTGLQSQSSSINIGDGTSTNWYRYNGNIALVRIYNKTLTQDEVYNNFSCTRSRYNL